jgi:hypothetical protein
MREDMHARGVHVTEPGSTFLGLSLHEVEGRPHKLLVHCFHTLARKRTSVLNNLFADLAVFWIDGLVVFVGRLAPEDTARAKLLAKLWILGIVRIFGFFLGVEVIEIAEELIETMHCWQMLVAVAKMVLAKLAGGVAEVLQELCNRRILGTKAQRRSRHTNLRQTGPDWCLARDEGSPSSSATLLAVEVREHGTFASDTIDVRCPISHDAVVVAAHIEPADIVGHYEKNIGLAGFWCLGHRYSPGYGRDISYGGDAKKYVTVTRCDAGSAHQIHEHIISGIDIGLNGCFNRLAIVSA